MKVCFIGIGSIAKRHIHNLRIICSERGIALQIDALRTKNLEDIEFVDRVYSDITQIPSDYDAVFITNPTFLHLSSLIDCHNKGKHFFIEKPVVSSNQIKEIINFIYRDNSIYYIASPLRYNSVIQYVKHNININEILSVRCISSSYLPDWRKGTDYRLSYSASKEMGGGVSTDLIHEWDYITYLFGFPEKISYIGGKRSLLEINSDDYALYIGENNKTTMELHLDYFGREPIREIQIFHQEETIIGDLINNKISFLHQKKEIDFSEERNDYQKKEITYFLDCVLENKIVNEIPNAIRVLGLTQGILYDK